MVDFGNPTSVTTEADPRSALKIPKPVDPVALQTTATTVFTARTDADFHFEALTASNVSGASTTLTVYMVPSGGSPSTANTILHQVPLDANTGLNIFNRENQGLLQPGYSIVALCGANDAVNVFGYGFDYQGIRQ